MHTPKAQRDRARSGATLAVALTHLALMSLALVNRLAFTVPPQYEFLAIAATNPLWIVLHGVAGLYLLISLWKFHEELFNATAAAAGIMGCWALLNLMWGLIPLAPVSLAGPVLAVGMSMVARYLASSWIQVGDHETRR